MIKANSDKISEMLILALLFYVGLFFIEISGFQLLLGLVVLFLSLIKRTFKITFENILLFMTFACYVIIDMFHNRVNPQYDYLENIMLVTNVTLGYFVGFQFLKNSKQAMENRFWKVFFVVSFSTALFAILGLIYKQFASPDFVEYLKQVKQDYYGRWGYDVWLREVVYPTNFNNQFVFAMSAVFGIIFYVRNRLSKYLLVLVILASLWSAFATSTRTNIYLLIISFGLGFILDFVFNQNEVGKRLLQSLKKYKVILISTMILLLISGSIMWRQIIKFIQESDLYLRFANLEKESMLNGRLDLSLNVIRNIPKFPFGNMDLFWAHNLWFDVARISGILPMLMLLAYSILTLISSIKLLRNRCVDIRIRLTCITIFIGTYLSFAIEPIIEGRPHLWLLFCVFNGMTYYLSNRRPENTQ